ncbi:ABC transporter permease [Microbacterium sp. Se5.02b]|uniref:ABC transporter permease n=1 Tax=Microbacterium sp. Se5.02b TaxID=2864103 RepID=UPI00215DACC7|nr:hypothetical protein [Microbacterium sp. Se5.02b]
MSAANIGIIARLELTQRLRSVGWYVLLGVFALVLLGVTGLAFAVYSWGDFVGAGVYSIVVNIVLLLVVLVSPTLSGNAINGDRDAATLAAIQVTAASTGDIMLGKLLAAVATGVLSWRSRCLSSPCRCWAGERTRSCCSSRCSCSPPRSSSSPRSGSA